MNTVFAVYGAGAYGREVMPLLRDELGCDASLFFVVDGKPTVGHVNGYPVISFDGFCQMPASKKYFSIAISDSYVREETFNKCISLGFHPHSLFAKNTVIMDDVTVGDGVIMSPFSCLTSNIEIGVCFQANMYSYVAHDCKIGDFVTFSPGVKCNGNVVIEDHVFIGSGAIIKPGTQESPIVIGRGAKIGMGTMVVQSVPAGAIVLGNPARVFSMNR